MFDRFVQDKRRRRPLLVAALVAAGLAECCAIAGFMIASLWHVDEVEAPPLYALLVRPVFIPPPVLVPSRRDPPIRPQTPRKPSRAAPLVQPSLLRPPVAAPAESQTEETDPGPQGPAVPIVGPPGISERPEPPPPLPPPPPPPPPRKVPQFLIRKQQLSGADPHLPAAVKQQHRGQTLTGSYLMCIDKSGHISSVTTTASIPGGDEEIIKTLQSWTYKEQLIPVCFVQNFEFVVE